MKTRFITKEGGFSLKNEKTNEVLVDIEIDEESFKVIGKKGHTLLTNCYKKALKMAKDIARIEEKQKGK